MDTWFSSALWPFATLGWPIACSEIKNQKSKIKICEPKENSDLIQYYPTQVLSTARDIINLWVGRMVFSGQEFMGKEPFSDVIIHATILAKDGRRMSKSLGTGIDPMTLIDQHGADATRFGLIWQAMGGQDIKWADEHVLAGKKFANKLWNISRFVLTKTEGFFTFTRPQNIKQKENKEFCDELDRVCAQAEKDIQKYEFGPALHGLYEFIWHEFADKYIEWSKDNQEEETKQTLLYALLRIIKVLHPFIPFVTEAIYQRLPNKEKDLLMVEEWQ